MKNELLIRVSGVQKDDKGEENKIQLTTEGVIYKKSNSIFIVYRESEISGMEGTTTTLKIEGDNRVSLKRYGSNQAFMVFEKGKRCKSPYNTLFGNFQMEVYTNNLEVNICEDFRHGDIDISYNLRILGLVETSNSLNISFKA
ncbi:DUF1934 domain-containing protein [Alkaliphilus pronyensis]|uniref:DUF1934 domain-containing protein n=1 Tax=Alkaliphilus pronyensis TaxID=1482732 RepID=A0A6I0FXN5_9FIRM|nr:DUF1934 domain-containing protein [Alkaliphilus pronyensis]KAB3540954.1 DUF1934 domain-containing protein [Alkaliphilus pronyensis]